MLLWTLFSFGRWTYDFYTDLQLVAELLQFDVRKNAKGEYYGAIYNPNFKELSDLECKIWALLVFLFIVAPVIACYRVVFDILHHNGYSN